MHFRSFVASAATVVALSSCQLSDIAKPDIPGPTPPAADACGATELAFVVGMTATDVDFGTRSSVRIISPDTAVTMDHNPARLNVNTDTSGKITSLNCG